MPSTDPIVFISEKDVNDQVKNTRSKVAVTLDIAALPINDVDSKIRSIDLSIAYLLRLRAELVVKRMMLRLKNNPARRIW